MALRNQKVQRVRRLLRSRTARESERVFVLEGPLLLDAAIDSGVPLESVFAAPGADAELLDRARRRGAEVFTLAEGVMERVADAVTPQAVAAVVPFVDRDPEALHDASFVVVCVELRDPGNAGAVLRTAEAAGAAGVVFSDGSVDVYNPKTVRASAGSVLRVPIVVGGDPIKVLRRFEEWGLRRIGAAAHGGADPTTLDLSEPLALVLGNEAHGLPQDVDEVLDQRVTVPVAGRVESLNVAAAAAVLCFEVARQRRAS